MAREAAIECHCRLAYSFHLAATTFNAGIERAAEIVSSIQVLRMKGVLTPLRSNDLFGCL
jgi:hypothetical protein